MKYSQIHAVIAAALVTATPSWATVTLHSLFTDNGVVQRGIKLPIYGTADNGEKVTVQFCGQTASTVAADGKWMLRLKPLAAGGPYDMVVKGTNKLVVKNLMVGDVWVCSGQSNMQFYLQSSDGGAEAIKKSSNPMIRLYDVPMTISNEPVSDAKQAWRVCAPETVPTFSAVGYYFGRALQRDEKIPVGLINSSLGGTRVEAWTNPKVLDPKDAAQWATDRVNLPEWAQKPNDPSVLYNGMICPLIPYGIKGVIWYQGETNAGRASIYERRFTDMIVNWRKEWGLGNFPFLFVQLAPFTAIVHEPQESQWAELREAQRLTAIHCSNTAMAVITDHGNPDDIHPIWKEPVGERLALAARAIAYKRHITYKGPDYKGVKFSNGIAIVSFNSVAKGLVAKGGPLTGWTIAGADKKWYNAEAVIAGKTVKVSSPSVPTPVAVRYGWYYCPVVNLYNSEGLPASPFRTDNWTLSTEAASK